MAHDVKVGTYCAPDAGRDAIHIAIAPVVAGQLLKPGEHIGFLDVPDVDQMTVGRCREKHHTGPHVGHASVRDGGYYVAWQDGVVLKDTRN
jgi:hypothetical protein